MSEKPKIGTPNNVNVLLHCHCIREPHPRKDAPAVKECLDDLLDLGAIYETGYENIFRTTELGEAWVKAICNTKMPKQLFIDEHGNEL